ncbi:MAG: helix-hairpin-helix domain-containing protein [Bacteroidetes bacterium]|nr:helix-hairpin-helix domain-containing protein [Bacteroidota bacterium]
MKIDFSPIRNWFGYTRRERRASLILIMLIISVISVRFFVPDKRISVKEIPVETFYAIRDTISMIKVETNPPVKNIAIQRKKTLTVDINRCDTAELIRLPGIGPVLSVRIIKYRQLLGGYVNKEQLKEVYGLPPETYETIMDMVTVDTLYIKKIEINSADYKILARIPYFTRSEVNSILKYRELEGRIKSLEELIDNKIIGVETARKVKSYMIFK